MSSGALSRSNSVSVDRQRWRWPPRCPKVQGYEPEGHGITALTAFFLGHMQSP
jgi:hypothetical protein